MASYVVVHLEKVKDPVGFHSYLANALPPVLAKFGGEFIMRARPLERLMGAWEPAMNVLGVIRFEDPAQPARMFSSDDYRAPKALLKQSADVSVVVFEGVDGL